MKLFSTEQVSKYHPDKYADQISDAILDACLAEDKNSRVACETMVKGSTIILAGEITTTAKVNYSKVAHRVAQKLGYKADNILTYIDTQSPEIAGGVKSGEELGAGDQGMMYGFACNETESMLPFGFDLANKIIAAIENDVGSNPLTIFNGDAKCQVTVDRAYSDLDMQSVQKILVSACHKEQYSIERVKTEISSLLKNLGVPETVETIINPAGAWTIGGPAADCGLTGRKIVCDQYGGYTPVGGGAFSGKDPSKVDRTGAYMARQIACDLVKKYNLPWCAVQLAYAIGQKEPMSVIAETSPYITKNSNLTAEVLKTYDLTPHGMIKHLDLLNTKYEKLAEGCHFRQKMRL